MHTNLDYKDLRTTLNDLNKDITHFSNSNDICTPMDLVEDMIDKIPEEFWNRDFISIFDPCAGNGNFPAYLLQKPKNKFKLTINEINNKRLFYLNKFFNSNDNIDIISKDFIEGRFEEHDLIIANPPYALFSNNKRAAKNHGVSKLFIKKSLNLLKDNGYLVYIVPDNWMSLSDRNDIAFLLSHFQFIYLDIHGAKKHFPGVGSSFTWFVLQKKENKKPFIIQNNFIKEEESLASLNKGVYSIPLFYNNIVKSILDKTIYKNNKKIPIKTSSNLHKYTKKELLSSNKTEDFKYEVIHTQSQTVFSKTPHKFQNGWKVFISLTSYYSTFIAKDKGMTQSIAFIKAKDKEECIKLKKILDNNLYIFLNNIHRYGNFNNIRILQKFPYPENNDNIYESFNITDEEIKLIENLIVRG